MSDVGRVRSHGRDGAVVTTRYRRTGAGMPLVLVHGVGMRLEAWQPQIDALGASFDVIAYDMLGHGGSSLPPADARLSDYADQLRGLLDALNVPAACVAGHSMGALVVLEFALAHPERVLGLAALNAVYCRAPEPRAAVEARARALAEEGAGAPHADSVRRWFGEPVPPEREALAVRVGGFLAACDPVGYARTYRLFAHSDAVHRGRLRDLVVPALFFTGAFDPNSTPAMSRAMAGEAPLGTCAVLADERHMMNLTAPDAVTDRLRGFFAGLHAPAVQP